MTTVIEVLSSIHRWDVQVFQSISASRLRQALITAAKFVSKSADGWAYPILPVIAFALGSDAWVTFFLVLLLAFVSERVIYLIAKKGFKRRRPPVVIPEFSSLIIASDEFSFPSGHTSAAFLAATMTMLFFGEAFALLYLWSAAVACSRMILGVHFPTDTFVGAAMGSSIAIISYVTYF